MYVCMQCMYVCIITYVQLMCTEHGNAFKFMNTCVILIPAFYKYIHVHMYIHLWDACNCMIKVINNYVIHTYRSVSLLMYVCNTLLALQAR